MMIRTALLATVALGSMIQPAFAGEGDWLVRARAINVAPQESSGDVLPMFPGGSVSIDDAWVPELDFTYFFNEKWSAELILGTSPHDLEGEGILAPLGKIAEVKTLPPTLTLQYRFAPGEKIQPYVGVGLNYTIFYDTDATTNLTDAVGPTKIDLDDSFGIALQAGLDIPLNDKWSANIDVKYIQMETTATLNSGGAINNVDVDLNPVVFGIGLGYRF